MAGLAELQAKWREANDKAIEAAYALERQYQRPWYVWAPRGKRERQDKLHKRADVAMERVFVWLDRHSPRSWRTGVPAFWVCDQLTEADALTSGPLSVVPPPGYGSLPGHMERFARALQPGEMSWA